MQIASVLGLRKHKRYLVDFDASIHEQTHRLNLKGRVKDISENGLMLLCRDSINPGSLLELDFQLPHVAEEAMPTVHVSAKVTRCMLRQDGTFFEVAVNFKRFADEQEVSFRRYLERLGG